MVVEETFGLLLVDKPSGLTSHDVVQSIRKVSRIQKVGHTGTLDPLASGLLVLCLGPATRLSEYLTKQDKHYLAQIHFGIATDTHDAEGQVSQDNLPIPELTQIEEALATFTGEIDQVPPSHSAIKVQGKRAYQLARAGEEVKLASRQVTIYEVQLLAYKPPVLELEIHCSSGTYIRSLARDLAAALGTGGHITGLRRTRVGSFQIEEALPLDELLSINKQGQWQSVVIPAAEALPDLPVIQLKADQVEDVRHGRPVITSSPPSGLARGLSQSGDLVAILEGKEEQSMWQPRKVFVS